MLESRKSSKIPNIVTPKGFGHLLLIMYSLKICFFFSECNKKFCTNFSSKYNTWSKVCANLGTKHRYCFDFYHMVNILVQTSRELFIKFNMCTNKLRICWMRRIQFGLLEVLFSKLTIYIDFFQVYNGKTNHPILFFVFEARATPCCSSADKAFVYPPHSTLLPGSSFLLCL